MDHIRTSARAKRPFGGPEHVLRYLGRYTHRVAISNHRLVSFAEGKVTFRWRDSAHHNEQKPMALPLDDFLRRFLLHLLPKGFVRIRNFGFWPTASVPPPCPSASKHSLQRQNGKSSEILPPPNSATLGAVLNAVPRWRSSKGSRLLKFSFVLHPCPHETTLSNSNPLRA